VDALTGPGHSVSAFELRATDILNIFGGSDQRTDSDSDACARQY
jgi:hypothetical protein